MRAPIARTRDSIDFCLTFVKPMRDESLAWSEALIAAAKAAGMWDETASLSKRADAIGAQLNYSGRQVLRWLQQAGSVPDAAERARLLSLFAPVPPSPRVVREHSPSYNAGSVFQDEAERRGYLRRVLEDAHRAIADAREALDASVRTTQ
jgi:hypothetical protein